MVEGNTGFRWRAVCLTSGVTDKSDSKQDGGHRERGKKQTWRRVWEALWLRHLSGSVGWRVRIDMDTRDPEEKAGTSWHIVGDQGRV